MRQMDVVYRFLAVSLLCFQPLVGAAEEITVKKERIASVLPGYILQLENGNNLRLNGILAPEMVLSDISDAFTGYYKQHLVDYMQKEVTLLHAASHSDRYGNSISDAYIWLSDDVSTSLQKHLVAEGLAIAYPTGVDSHKYQELQQIETKARQNKRGIWVQSDVVISASNAVLMPDKYVDSFRIVRGEVHSIAERKNYIYVNFGEDWKTDFTLRFDKKVQKEIGKAKILQLAGKTIEARGWLENYYGPMMDITSPGQIMMMPED